MYERLLRLYKEGRLKEHMLKNAVKFRWITEEQAETIRQSK